jgi:hypothetical protein
MNTLIKKNPRPADLPPTPNQREKIQTLMENLKVLMDEASRSEFDGFYSVGEANLKAVYYMMYELGVVPYGGLE